MKKLFYAFSALLLVLTSCSSDENSTATTAPVVLLKKKIETYTDGSGLTTDYTYDGNKVVTESSNGGTYSNFTYTGDLITGIETFNSNDELITAKVFTYNIEGELISGIYKDFMNDYAFKEISTYNLYGWPTKTMFYIGNLTSQTQSGSHYKYYYTNGEVVKKEYLDDLGIFFGAADYVTYDNKNNPYKNITGMGKLQNSFGVVNGISQNVVTSVLHGENLVNEYTYNSNSYPTVETRKEDGVVVGTIQYFYE